MSVFHGQNIGGKERKMRNPDLPRLKFENEQRANAEEIEGKERLSAMPVRVTLNTNNNCNIHCRFCGFSSKKDAVIGSGRIKMEADVLEKAADELFPTAWEVLPTTYGEPLLYDRLTELVDFVRKNHCRTSLYTNGTLLDRNILSLLMPYISDLKVSFDAATKSTYETLRSGARFEKVIEGIRLFDSLRNNYRYTKPPTLTIQYTLMRSNIEELPAAVELAADLGADRIAASHIYVFFRSQRDESLFFHQELSDSLLKEAYDVARCLGIRAFFPRPYHGSAETMAQLFRSGTCSYLYKETWISTNGDVHPCFMPDSPVVGNLIEQPFKEIWNGPIYSRMRRTVKTQKPVFPRCQDCPIRMQFDAQYQGGYKETGFVFYDLNEANR